MKKFFYFLSFVFIVTFLLPLMNVRAESVVDEIRINSDTSSVVVGELGEFNFTTTTEHITIDSYGSNTHWAKWASGYSSWHGFGTETPTAVADGTHYALCFSVNLESGYTFSANPTIYLNGVNYTSSGYTTLDDDFSWGGYLYVDLGTATEAAVIPDEDDLTPITSMNVTVKAPKIGDNVEEIKINEDGFSYPSQSLKPEIVLESGANYAVGSTYYITAFPSEKPDGYDEMFLGTFEKDKYYYVEVYIVPKTGYTFDPEINVKINGVESYEMSEWNGPNQVMFYAKVKAGTKDDSSSDKVLEGANQEFCVGNNKKLVFRFDIPFSEFKSSGKVYMDGKLVDSKNYALSEGSTVITFNSDYTKTLAEGNHTLRMVSDNNDVSTSFKVVSNPNTGDNVIIYLLLAIIGISGMLVTGKKINKIMR